MNWENLHIATREEHQFLFNNIGLDRIDKFTVGDRIDSDHRPITATFKFTYRRGEVDEEKFPSTFLFLNLT